MGPKAVLAPMHVERTRGVVVVVEVVGKWNTRGGKGCLGEGC